MVFLRFEPFRLSALADFDLLDEAVVLCKWVRGLCYVDVLLVAVLDILRW